MTSSNYDLPNWTAFAGDSQIAAGDAVTVARRVKRMLDVGEHRPILIFDDATGELVELDARGTVEDVAERVLTQFPVQKSKVEAPVERGSGRPKLGVVAREVTLLPHHWAWLNSQSGGASITLRKLVEEERRIRHAREVAYRFMHAMAGDLPLFEEATRALFNGSGRDFHETTEGWPKDIRDHIRHLAANAFRGLDAAALKGEGVFYSARLSKPETAGA